MSTCPCCHQAIPQTCDRDDCDDQIIFVDGVPSVYQNHPKKHAKEKQELRAGKPPVATVEEQRSLMDAIKEQSG